MSRALLLTRDLMFSSRVSSIARQLNIPLQVCQDVAGVQAALEPEEPAADSLPEVELAFIDLETPQVDAASLIQMARQLPSGPRWVGYAKHGRVDLLKEARQAGFDDVLTRGQFDQQMATLLHELAEQAS